MTLLVRVCVLALALVMTERTAAAAGDGLTPLTTSMSDAEIDQRIRFLEDRLDGSKLHGQIWYWSWMTIDVGSTVYLGVAAGLDDKEDDAVNNGVNAGLSAIGVADLLLRPLEARYGADHIRPMPEQTREEKIVKLRTAEDQLQRNAKREEDRFSLLVQGGNVALALAGGTAVGLAGNPSDGITTGAFAFLGGLINIFSEPWAPGRDWEEYKALGRSNPDLTQVQLQVRPLADGGMVGLRVVW